MSARRILTTVAVIAACAAVAPAASATAGPVRSAPAAATEQDLAAAAEQRWATSAEVTREASAPEAADGLAGQPRASGMRDRIVNAAYWYRNYGTPYVWSSGWLPCNKNAADCECLNRLAYWDGGWGQLTYTLQGQANTGRFTRNPRPGDLVFWDYDGNGRFGPYDHTGVYVGNGYAIHASTYWGRVVRTTVRAVSVEARGTYYVTILG